MYLEWGTQEIRTEFSWEYLLENAHMKDRERDRRIKIKMGLRERGFEDRRWKELAQNRVQWRASVLAMLNLLVLLPQC
jgi:hypothetical protein